MEIYVVQQGDTVDAIASFYKVPASTVIYDNQLAYPYQLATGQALLLPDGKDRPRRQILTGGYAYPFISEWVLEQTLPFLSDLYIFSYGFNADGSLIPPQLDDQWMISKANNQGVAPVLTLTPFGADGTFDNNLITEILREPSSQQRLIQQLILTMRTKGYRGINIDFEYIKAEDSLLFVNFVRTMTIQMNQLRYAVSVALVPKVSDNQRGYLYEGMDYQALGAAANYVFLMTYEWGYTYGPPMAVAPINQVRRVVEYAVSKIPREKIVLGIPNYGYDWELPFVQGTTKARTLGNIEAVVQAVDKGVAIQFDVTAQSPYYHYQEDGVIHEVWFEDVRSLRAKFQLIEEFQLKGAGYWQIMQFFRPNWLLLNDRFIIWK